jgi:hypothetical protein
MLISGAEKKNLLENVHLEDKVGDVRILLRWILER